MMGTAQGLKWLATVTLIVGTFFNAGRPDLFPLGPLLLGVGGVLWLIVSIMWREAALIVTNGVLVAVGFGGLLLHYLG